MTNPSTLREELIKNLGWYASGANSTEVIDAILDAVIAKVPERSDDDTLEFNKGFNWAIELMKAELQSAKSGK